MSFPSVSLISVHAQSLVLSMGSPLYLRSLFTAVNMVLQDIVSSEISKSVSMSSMMAS